ncbi:MAG: hypothetical protein A3D24_03630 [Candidatus Blackburnbacteria bacterium RIFCSPHIGHO2_02_FULL_39_13]|uniref:HhH-GPD domain-containing protein n=1 Tax=Candidatus Blackburnbacteria bacterium RIFCSPLOWO2_01_FULL_40_20 TaxID=1797519 RepID=A0A1G1VEP8_9BACT|nr:MAG: hypothetical protein A2694_01230 [Candidatus Blackburnbacteria bacterium RIFCSPHIGHO2_01_FULL_40_17]OGY09993.1 MAG: hypothetical protein A3D24_03630 [Candidatus Blackburnbacteria bacterium RIFCSPHIGHO2_02_FULL_39_13]OGY13839.1 MAG: hypothetical protein A3A77_03620 [Candidatus Blackburnbacteria bacterium RIFCSPLOWO2_01_FULL_40_20]
MLTPSPQKVFLSFAKNYKEIPLIPVSKTPFEILVATVLSARTRDEVTAKVCVELFKQASTPKEVSKMRIGDIETMLHRLGFYKAKAINLKKLSEILVERFNNEVPRSLENLTSLPGVGRKTANVVLARAFKIPAIGVDTHVHRIANMLGWVNTETPEQTEAELTKVLPKKYWVDINRLFVSIGQQCRNNIQLEKFLKKNKLIK